MLVLYSCLLFVFAMYAPLLVCLFRVVDDERNKTPLITLGFPIVAMHANRCSTDDVPHWIMNDGS